MKHTTVDLEPTCALGPVASSSKQPVGGFLGSGLAGLVWRYSSEQEGRGLESEDEGYSSSREFNFES